MLTTKQAIDFLESKGINKTQEDVARLAKRRVFPGAIKDNSGKWWIPQSDLENYITHKGRPRLRNRVITAASVVTIVTILGIVSVAKDFLDLITTYIFDFPDSASTADMVIKCVERHNMSKSSQVIKEVDITPRPGENEFQISDLYGNRIFKFCDWPPPSFAEPDGYTEIHVMTVPGPEAVSNLSFAELTAPLADRIISNCQRLSLSYNFGRQGVYAHQPPFIVETDSIVDPFGNPWVFPDDDLFIGESAYLGFDPQRGEVIVLHTYDWNLDRVECIK